MNGLKHLTLAAGLLLASAAGGNAAFERFAGLTSDPAQDNFTRCSFAPPDGETASDSPIPDCAILARLVE